MPETKGPTRRSRRRGRKFAANEIGDGFIGLGRVAGAKKIAKDGEARSPAEKRGPQNARTHGHILELAIDQDEARSFGIGEETLFQKAQVLADRVDAGIAAETLRAAFQEKAIATDRLDGAARTRASLREREWKCRIFSARVRR